MRTRRLSSTEGETTAAVSTVDSDGDTALDHTALPAATLLLHPDGRRLGERAALHELHNGMPVAISRSYPSFSASSTPRSGRPLDDPHVSRTPLWIRREGTDLVFSVGHSGVRATVDGQPLAGEIRLPYERLVGGGVILGLGGHLILWLHMAVGAPPAVAWHSLLGVSPVMVQLRERIARLAGTPYPVMLRGESGVGKELVARAIHQAGPRTRGPYVTLNMAAVPPSVAAAELFGYERGAFTGAAQARKGRFEQADGGTLFLDEIGEAPAEVQTQLLRALDSGEIQPLGGQTRRVDVRVISATDADLEARIAERHFSKALLYRLQSSLLEVPALRERRVDIPILLHHFLAEALRTTGARDRLAFTAPPERPWLGTRLVEALLAWPFPGNVRELKNFANEIALHSAESIRAEMPPDLVARLARGHDAKLDPAPRPLPRAAEMASGGPAPADPEQARREAPASPRPAHREGRGLTVARVEEALRRNDWTLARTAVELGVARNTLNRFIEESPELYRPLNLDPTAILEALARHSGDIEAAAGELRISAHGLRLRMNALKLTEKSRK